jgi:UDP-N-acetylmuramate dehydrogenase
MNLLGGEKTVPQFAMGEKHTKIPAAWLIEHSGFKKGYRKGNAGISSKHNLAIINCGGAKATEILNIKFEIQNAVREKFDIELLTEPVFVGFD